MVVEGKGTSGDAVVAAVRALASLTARLSAAADEPTVLRLVMSYLQPFGPAEAQLVQLHCDTQGVPREFQYVAAWHHESPVAPPVAAPQTIPDDSLLRKCLHIPGEPLLITHPAESHFGDTAMPPSAARKLPAAVALLPLHSDRFAGWQGVLVLSWESAHDFSPLERSVYELLLPMLATDVGGFRTQRRLSAELAATTEQCQTARAETEEQRGMLRTVLDHIPVGVIIVDAKTKRQLLGNVWTDHLFGHNRDKVAGGIDLIRHHRMVYSGTDTLLSPQDLPSQRALSAGKLAVTEFDYLIGAEEKRVNVEATGVPIRDENGVMTKALVLIFDLTARKNAERTRLQEELIRVQAAALTERSSPLIPITDEILVLPLIGSIDAERSRQVLDTVLEGSSQRGARFTIIDITGVRMLDTHAAATLTNAARALRLLGVEPILTGIRAEVAQTLVGLGVELSMIMTRSTLQAGIKYALGRLGKSHFG